MRKCAFRSSTFSTHATTASVASVRWLHIILNSFIPDPGFLHFFWRNSYITTDLQPNACVSHAKDKISTLLSIPRDCITISPLDDGVSYDLCIDLSRPIRVDLAPGDRWLVVTFSRQFELPPPLEDCEDDFLALIRNETGILDQPKVDADRASIPAVVRISFCPPVIEADFTFERIGHCLRQIRIVPDMRVRAVKLVLCAEARDCLPAAVALRFWGVELADGENFMEYGIPELSRIEVVEKNVGSVRVEFEGVWGSFKYDPAVDSIDSLREVIGFRFSKLPPAVELVADGCVLEGGTMLRDIESVIARP
jgi:hypothetical protein